MIADTDYYCDKGNCSAQYQVRVAFPITKLDLQFCKHHYERYEIDLMTYGVELTEDKRDKINKKPSPSASI